MWIHVYIYIYKYVCYIKRSTSNWKKIHFSFGSFTVAALVGRFFLLPSLWCSFMLPFPRIAKIKKFFNIIAVHVFCSFNIFWYLKWFFIWFFLLVLAFGIQAFFLSFFFSTMKINSKHGTDDNNWILFSFIRILCFCLFFFCFDGLKFKSFIASFFNRYFSDKMLFG